MMIPMERRAGRRIVSTRGSCSIRGAFFTFKAVSLFRFGFAGVYHSRALAQTITFGEIVPVFYW